MNEKILVVDDEVAIAEIIEYNLKREGYSVSTAFDGREGLDMLDKESFDLIILDVMMPKIDGFTVLKELRKNYRTPVIMLTAKEEEVDKILGLELGADDYVVKPFSMRELTARIKAILRRRDFEVSNIEEPQIIEAQDLIIDLTKYEIRKKGKVIELTLREYELLKYLASHPGQVFSRELLLNEVWEYGYYGDIRTVDVTVRRLREKIEDKDKDYKYIMTKRGVGYYFGG
ncbi:two-component system, OmpR family, response regulator VicR [Anaerosphaera aminiphila DSM 21120]|uniref:Two-component system, OmpR family, response regulator VicR n=1 Tax=Anaerosphaera aminiphila DSM 21120 TaxID=1120995 RepID=A0A1M5SPF5_9FIRM|nr:response regulator [Anaerosphaera aminiphila]SHH40424.1 two-component system, OmpR family, response regulator VicR [Anaerosphaera aminiphila DSM 21120]